MEAHFSKFLFTENPNSHIHRHRSIQHWGKYLNIIDKALRTRTLSIFLCLICVRSFVLSSRCWKDLSISIRGGLKKNNMRHFLRGMHISTFF